jgi:hypothetical protein
MAIQKKSLNRSAKSSNKAKAMTVRGAKPKAAVRGTKEVSLRRNVEFLPAVQ